jgi:hypothetical protein
MDTSYNDKNTQKDITTIAETLDINLDIEQLHVGGERAILSPSKFVLIGTKNSGGTRVVLKCAREAHGVNEITTEHNVRQALQDVHFADEDLSMPEEIFYGQCHGYTVLISEFIEQMQVFVDHSLREQFFMALQAFEAQEAFHATTREHRSFANRLFLSHSPERYLEDIDTQIANITTHNSQLSRTLTQAATFVRSHTDILTAFDGYLIHTDFVPHNFRITDNQLYLLDYVSFAVGNKYESWARFINFMEIHSPALVPLLLQYVKDDRGESEYKSLQIMRVIKIIFLLNYYTNALPQTDGNLYTLTTTRLSLWHDILQAVIKDVAVTENTRLNYLAARDQLRTEEEKKRQREFTRA